MICSNCGCDIPENENNCPNCGCDCNEKVADNNIRSVSDASVKKNKMTMPDTDWRKEWYIGSGDEQNDSEENQHVYPTMRRRGTDEGIPDMDLGKTTRYFAKKRTSAAKKTRWEKLVLKFRPKDETEPMESLQAANRNAGFAIFLHILSFLGFVSGLIWALDPYYISVFNIFFCIAGFFISIVSIDFSDAAAEYYKKFYKKDILRAKALNFISHSMFWITAGMSVFIIAYKLLIGTGFLQAISSGYRWT